MRRGFTLVELSIVLVIVGLLIGGILVGQSMVSTSRIVAVSAQVQQFDAGVMNFKTKYNYLPGDAPAFSGDGNWILNRHDGRSVNVFDCEIANFWIQLDPQNYNDIPICTSKGKRPVAKGSVRNVPLAKLGKEGSYFIASSVTTVSGDHYSTDLSNPINYYSILDPSNNQTTPASTYWEFINTSSINSAVKPAEAFALDKKLDDGYANSGLYTFRIHWRCNR